MVAATETNGKISHIELSARVCSVIKNLGENCTLEQVRNHLAEDGLDCSAPAFFRNRTKLFGPRHPHAPPSGAKPPPRGRRQPKPGRRPRKPVLPLAPRRSAAAEAAELLELVQRAGGILQVNRLLRAVLEEELP
jgi:hypothetical protein